MSIAIDISRKKTIKTAARQLFFQFGFQKTSMDDIGRQSGLAKPTLYYYYKNKESIFNEIVMEEAEIFMNELQQKIPKNLPADETISQFFGILYFNLKQYFKKMQDMPDCLCEGYPRGRPIVEKIHELIGEKLKPILKAGRQDGTFAIEDEETALKALIHMTNFINLDWMRRMPEDNRDSIVQHSIAIMMNGLKRRSE